jgi:hypothetical protein
MERWAIHIDIEGFVELWERENNILIALSRLMEGIFLIGNYVYAESPERIFAHQIGDGFIIVGEFGDESFHIPLAIAIVLMKHVAVSGRFAKAAIAEGHFGDITCCYPPVVRDAIGPDHRVRLGRGVMTIFPVMGTALIHAVGIAKRSPKGSLLTITISSANNLSPDVLTSEIPGSDLLSVDWLHSSFPLAARIQKKAKLQGSDIKAIENLLLDYMQKQDPPQEWKRNTVFFLNLAVPLHGRL